MADRYLSFANSSFGKSLCGLLGLPIPTPLQRASHSAQSITGKLLVGSAHKSELLLTALKDLDQSNLTINSSTEFPTGSLSCGDLAKETKLNGLIFDASQIKNSEELTALHSFFQPNIKQLAPCARVIVVGINPKLCNDSQQATAQRALLGFIKTISKEVGRKGATAQLLWATPDCQQELVEPLRFLLSPKSAFITGQSLVIDRAITNFVDINTAKPLENKVALVTGAARGIGAQVAQILARDGATVIGLDVPQAEAELTATMAEINGIALPLNITDVDAGDKITQLISAKFSKLDIIVHNAGITRDKTLARMSEDQWNLLMDINLNSIQKINSVLLENNTLAQGGRIIGVSSISGIGGNFGQSNYATSKAGVIGMVESMAPQLAENGITINAVAPGFIETQMTAAIPFMTRQLGRRLCSLSQGGQPQDVAEAIAFFANPNSNGVTGNVLRVCGQSITGA